MRLVAAPVRHLAWRSSFPQTVSRASSTSSAVPRVASIWQSLIPKAFRQPDDPVSRAERQKAKANKSKDWNPATFFIVISLLIGSNAIQMISLRYERLNFSRRTDAKIALLRETIERVRRGEDVDVERALGTGNPEKEKEWEQVMREIESDDSLWQGKKQKRDQSPRSQDQESSSSSSVSKATTTSDQHSTTADSTPRRPGFY